MSMSQVKEEENLRGDESEPWQEEMLDIKYDDIKMEVKEESNYGNLVCIINDMLLAEYLCEWLK